MREYFGVADCHGIESFLPLNEEHKDKITVFNFRARANDQRRALVYKVSLREEEVGVIDKCIRDGKFVEALNFIKDIGEDIGLIGPGSEELLLKWWDSIPDPELDPWRV